MVEFTSCVWVFVFDRRFRCLLLLRRTAYTISYFIDLMLGTSTFAWGDICSGAVLGALTFVEASFSGRGFHKSDRLGPVTWTP